MLKLTHPYLADADDLNFSASISNLVIGKGDNFFFFFLYMSNRKQMSLNHIVMLKSPLKS